jgi:broad specificity phosphatase PhoE
VKIIRGSRALVPNDIVRRPSVAKPDRRPYLTRAMTKLILVKHAPPVIAPDVASPRWVLSEQGRERCAWLASELAGQGVTHIYSSLEPKALETAAQTAVRLGLEVRPRLDLHENDRAGLGFVSAETLRGRFQRFFDAPLELVMGNETASAAFRRFETAIRKLLAEAPDQTAAVVAHGTVLTLLATKHNPVPPFDFWSSLTLPSYVVLCVADFRLEGAMHNFPGG